MFDARLVNPPHGDPAVCLHFAGSTPAPDGSLYLFDCGSLLSLGHSEMLKIRRVFITHTHIDHAIGMDHLLRIQLYNSTPLEVYGPVGLIEQFSGRLRGYAWNLIGDSPFVVKLHELHERHILSRQLHCRNQFSPGRVSKRKHEGFLFLPEGCRLTWTHVDHGVPCLGFRLDGQTFYRFDERTAQSLALRPGPWIGDLKAEARKGRWKRKIKVQDQIKTVAEWTNLLLNVEAAPSFVYITDTLLGIRQIETFAKFAHGCDELWCEATYREADCEKATSNLHATASQAARLAKQAEAKKLFLFHFSRRYQGETAQHLAEARAIFPATELGKSIREIGRLNQVGWPIL